MQRAPGRGETPTGGRGRPALFVALLLVGALGALACGRGERSGRVLNVLEGDLLKVEMDGRWVRVELAGVDSPQRGQPYRDEARAFADRLVGDKQITVRVTGRGEAGHVLGEVLLPGGGTLNRELVAAGLAWHRGTWFARYPDIRELEQQARRRRRGLWRGADPVPPWEYLEGKSWRGSR